MQDSSAIRTRKTLRVYATLEKATSVMQDVSAIRGRKSRLMDTRIGITGKATSGATDHPCFSPLAFAAAYSAINFSRAR